MDVKQVLGKVAPWIGTALGGPLGGMAISAVADALGLSDKTEKAIKQAIAGATPEQMLAVQKADQEFALKMQELGFANEKDMESLASADRDSARKREIAVGDKTPRNLAYFVTCGFFAVLTALMFIKLPQGSRDILNIMLGSLGTAWTGIVMYYFGSTAGSARKTDLLARSTPTKDIDSKD